MERVIYDDFFADLRNLAEEVKKAKKDEGAS